MRPDSSSSLTTSAAAVFTHVASASGSGRLVADAMIHCPKTHDLDAGLGDILAFFEDDHVHMALVIAADRRLVTTIERPDIPAGATASMPAADLGTLIGRTVSPVAALGAATAVLLRGRRRRLAVVDDCGRLLGLLCLKMGGTGYCSDDGIRERTGRDACLPAAE